ncbi:hypothetical protein PS9374_05797 [Planomonospora sphaerica]|uniref:Uncharacterized protein n=1 Tax=Planomonospora sphaerica TaxID=161355 RepID=A0A161LM67_9ACTN|nr:hypothetical protein [Planomonospora sphaerica]GAT70117.1 hypothetical protein PS9374_05797 [Planomonospora sphaerica]
MSDGLEENLHAALRRAAERAPRAPGALSSQVAARSRRRRARAHALFAAAAVVVVAGGTGLAVRGAGGDTAPPVLSPSPASTAGTASGTPSPPAVPEPVEEVWPQAVWKIPARLPGGGKFQPRAFVDDRTVLLETWESFEKANALHAYDLDTGDVRKVADIRTPKGVFASGYSVGEGRIVWQTIEEGDGDESKGTRVTKFWSVPVEGGEPAAVTTDRPVVGRGDRLTVTGGKLAFSLFEGGVFTVPLGGGTVEPVPGADRHHILLWPWVGTPGEYTPDGEPSFEELLNAETGETSRATVRPGERNVRCGVTVCAGDRGDGTSFHRSRDGSQELDLPSGVFAEPALDRFYAAHLPGSPGGQYLYDRLTGRSGDLGLRPNARGESIAITLSPGVNDGRLVAYPLKGKYVIIDLERLAEGS